MAAPVLVATDLSDAADEAIWQAHLCAERTGSDLVACHVVPELAPSHPLFPQLYEQDAQALMELENRALGLVRERVSSLTGRSPDDFGVDVDVGSPDAAVLAAAEHLDPSLLVLGAYGSTDMPHLSLGSVAKGVVMKATCAVLVVRETAGGPVVVATDLSESLTPLLARGHAEALAREARLVVLHSLDLLPPPAPGAVARASPNQRAVIDRLKDEARAKIAAALAALGANGGAEIVVTEGPPASDVVRAVVEREAELVVVGRYQAIGIAKLGLGRVAEDVVRSAPCSALVLPM